MKRIRTFVLSLRPILSPKFMDDWVENNLVKTIMFIKVFRFWVKEFFQSFSMKKV
jgi:hypothetical protein